MLRKRCGWYRNYTKCNFFFQAIGKMFRPVKHSSSITDRLACSYPAYECSGQRVEGYEYCIRHILEDKSAPYRPCGYVYSGNGRRCVMPTPKADKRETGYVLLEACCSIGWPQWIKCAIKEEITAVDCHQVWLHLLINTHTHPKVNQLVKMDFGYRVGYLSYKKCSLPSGTN